MHRKFEFSNSICINSNSYSEPIYPGYSFSSTNIVKLFIIAVSLPVKQVRDAEHPAAGWQPSAAKSTLRHVNVGI